MQARKIARDVILVGQEKCFGHHEDNGAGLDSRRSGRGHVVGGASEVFIPGRVEGVVVGPVSAEPGTTERCCEGSLVEKGDSLS